MEMKPSDAYLIRAYLKGKDTAFDSLFRRWERPLFSFVFRLMRDPQAAEDVFQQTWMKVLKGLSDYHEKGKFSSWLFGIANHCCIDEIRKKTRARINDCVSAAGMDNFESQVSNPERKLLKSEELQLLEKAVDRLPLEQKQVVLMRLHGEMPFKEIARILDSPLNTILGRMHYAMNNLKKSFNHEYGEDFENVLSRIQ